MALPKAGLAEKLEVGHQAQVEEIEKLIDEKLAKDYTGQELFYIPFRSSPHTKVIDELKRRYADAGWSLDFRCTQHDGCTIELR